jgi:putative transposase
VPTAAGFLFLAVVLDVWSRRKVDRAMAMELRTRLALDALDMALTTRRPVDVVIDNSARSSHRASRWSSGPAN